VRVRTGAPRPRALAEVLPALGVEVPGLGDVAGERHELVAHLGGGLHVDYRRAA
jgi:hypothetical protein